MLELAETLPERAAISSPAVRTAAGYPVQDRRRLSGGSQSGKKVKKFSNVPIRKPFSAADISPRSGAPSISPRPSQSSQARTPRTSDERDSKEDV